MQSVQKLLTLAVLLLASTAFPVAAQICCDDPTVQTFEAGVIDGFNPASPLEDAVPSPELAAFINGFSSLADFDGTTVNRFFAHTFTDLPPVICEATLEIHLRALPDNSNNDDLFLEFQAGGTPRFRWQQRIRVLAGVANWNSSVGDIVLTLDLGNLPPGFSGATNILPFLADGTLDVAVQDDTAVDAIVLTVTSCPLDPDPSCTQPPSDLIGWWPFDEPVGPTAADIMGSRDGTYVGGPQPVAGVRGRALNFPTAGDQLQIPDPASNLSFGPGQDFSLDFWIRIPNASGTQTIFEKRLEIAGQLHGYVVFVFNGLIGLQLSDGTFFNYISTVNVDDGGWHFITITVDRDNPGGLLFYDNGVLVGPALNPTNRTGSLANSGPLVINLDTQGITQSFNGALDELEIFRRVLTPGEVAAIFNGGKCKDDINVNWDSSICNGADSVTVQPRICNKGATEALYNLAFAQTPLPRDHCTVPGPVFFNLDEALPLIVPPGSCRSFDLEVGPPIGGEIAEPGCFRIFAQNLVTSTVTIADGAVWKQPRWCCDPVVDPVVDVPPGRTVAVQFNVENTSATAATLQFQFEGRTGDGRDGEVTVRLDGQSPGEPVLGQVSLAAGAQTTVEVEAALLADAPGEAQNVLLVNSADDSILSSVLLRSFAPGCTPGDTALCLQGGRFKVQASWRTPQGDTGVGHAVAITPDTGYFWFFNPENIEVVLKVLDARSFTDFWWVFYGALSNVEYTLTVTDTVTGQTKSYINPQGVLASIADTQAIPEDSPLVGPGLRSELPTFEQPAALPPIFDFVQVNASLACTATATALCLADGRFQVEVDWETPSGDTGVGRRGNLTDDTGYFWFFNPENIELVLKVLDGRSITGAWWVFYGALSNVEYTIRVTDMQTGAVKTYFNPQGNLASVADTSAFPEAPPSP
jgi:hypothetical protein